MSKAHNPIMTSSALGRGRSKQGDRHAARAPEDSGVGCKMRRQAHRVDRGRRPRCLHQHRFTSYLSGGTMSIAIFIQLLNGLQHGLLLFSLRRPTLIFVSRVCELAR